VEPLPEPDAELLPPDVVPLPLPEPEPLSVPEPEPLPPEPVPELLPLPEPEPLPPDDPLTSATIAVVALAVVLLAVVVPDDDPDCTWVRVSCADCREASASATCTFAALSSSLARTSPSPTWSPSWT
jgi:hypothetical protein